jgi:hypothetical protein
MASGDTLLVLYPFDNEPPASNYATIDMRNGHPVLDFDDTTAEAAVFTAVLPRAYTAGGLTVYLHYAMTSATTGKVRWEVSIERVGDGSQDIDSDGFATEQAVNVDPVPGTSGNVDIVAVTFGDGAQMDSVGTGETFRIKVVRDSADGTNDTATGDAELVAVEIKES